MYYYLFFYILNFTRDAAVTWTDFYFIFCSVHKRFIKKRLMTSYNRQIFSYAFWPRASVWLPEIKEFPNWYAMHLNNSDVYAMQEFNSICVLNAVPSRSILSCVF